MSEIDFMSVLHKSTSRDYLAIVNDKDYPKHQAADLAKKFSLININEGIINIKNGKSSGRIIIKL